MTDHFDPYHRWLGIPPKHQPADHYRLLGLERFEDDLEVIVDAAERQMTHVRRYALGPSQLLSQEILNELAAAQACLMDRVQKARYDEDLRQRQTAAMPQAASSPVAAPVVPQIDIVSAASSTAPKAVKIEYSANPRPAVPNPAPVIREVITAHRRGRRDVAKRLPHPQSATIRPRGWLEERLVAWSGVQTPRQFLLLRCLAIGVPLGLVVAGLLGGGDVVLAAASYVPVVLLAVVSGLLLAFGLSGSNRRSTFDRSTPAPVVESVPQAISRPPKPQSRQPAWPADAERGAVGAPSKREPPPLAVAPFDASQARAHQEAWARHLGQPVDVTNSIGMKLILIPPGEFMMGSPDDESGRRDDETRHRVRITEPYYLGVYEVTQREYERVMGTNPSLFKTVAGQDTSRFPVETVSWYDTIEFCNKLSVLERKTPYYKLTSVRRDGQTIISAVVQMLDGNGYRLVTEAQWEYAARAGISAIFPWGGTLSSSQANFNGNYPYGGAAQGPYLERTTTVGSYQPNVWGLHDTTGNVWEWVWDMYKAREYQQFARKTAVDPTGSLTGLTRVLRGGSWSGSGGICRSAIRSRRRPEIQLSSIGFRVAQGQSGE
ncbi:MAG: formylglycine-generating enzyme family protein [Pirellulaceae bacterium]|nr:formylglycine-generating enzyme family protein [Pirellulaceae bacterium]